MKLIIKNCIFFYKVIDENRKAAAKIKSMNLWSAAKKVTDIKGETVYTTDIKNSKADDDSHMYDGGRRYVIYQGRRIIATAHLKCAKDDGKNSAHPSPFKPSQVGELNIQTHYGELNIKRQDNHSFAICNKNVVIGSITSVLPLKKHYISCTTIKNPAFLAALYVLVMYMIEESNFILP